MRNKQKRVSLKLGGKLIKQIKAKGLHLTQVCTQALEDKLRNETAVVIKLESKIYNRLIVRGINIEEECQKHLKEQLLKDIKKRRRA